MRTADLVAAPELRLTVAVNGDLDREISWVHAIDRYPASEFMSGGEVALTSGQWWPAIDADTYIADLVGADVIALGFGLTSTLTELPSLLLEACEKYGMTYFLVPIEVPFIRVIKTFVQAQREQWERPLRHQLSFQSTFTQSLRSDRSLTTMLRLISKELGTRVALVADRTVYGTDSVEGMHPLQLESEGVTDASLYLDAEPAKLSLERQAALAIATPFVALEIERIRSVRSTVDGYTRELFTWLRLGNHDQVSVDARLDSLGVHAGPRMAILAISGPDLDGVLLAVRRELGATAVAARMDAIVLVCLSDTDATPIGQLTKALPATARTGVGSVGEPDRLRLSLIQAEHALQLASRMDPGAVVEAADLNSPSSILRSAPSDLVRETSEALLRPLREYDETRGGQLLRTLAVFLDVGGRLGLAANELYVHPNTLRHRIEIIEDITGRSLERTRDRTDFDIAISIARDADAGGAL